MSSNEPRDQLAGIFRAEYAAAPDFPTGRALINAILREGWRPPPRVIETPEELDALPGGSIVITPAAYVWRHARPGTRFPWRLLDHGRDGSAADVLRDGQQSVTVLVEPEMEEDD